ncbi:MAG: SGNH/GDSL hydrolase family protein [Xanthobacteraceae bacterium]|nr:SGNH/GDSL hydrolase family protein [Xanthobacteraceae bacterium]
MKSFVIALISVLLCASAALAEEHEDCAVAAHLVTADYPLPRVARAIEQKELKVVVVGSASSLLAGPGGKQEAAYPTRLEAALSKRLPGVKVTVATFAKPRTTADSMEEDIERLVHTEKPAVVIWQTGTVDAIRRIDPEDFRSAIDQGVAAVLEADSDVILMNPQYSPRTESMIEVQPYVDAMRFSALQHEVPLFDRFAVMRQWGELGTFDLLDPTKKTDMAERVHQCVAELLADLIVQSAKVPDGHDNHQ